MKINTFIFALSVFFMGTFGNVAGATIIVMEDFSNEAEMDSLLASDDTSITATAVVRAGGGNTYELGIGDFETLTDFGNITWNINGDNSFTLSYNGMNGNYDLGVVGSSGATINTGPDDWFNQLAFSFGSGGVEIDFTGTINGESFSTYNSHSAGQWDGILFTFPEFNADNVGSFNITGTMAVDSALGPVSLDQFRGEFYLIKNTAVVPEPSSIALLVSGLAFAMALRRRKQ